MGTDEREAAGKLRAGLRGAHLLLHIEGHGVSYAGVNGEGEVAVDDGCAGDALPVGCTPHEVVWIGDGMAVEDDKHMSHHIDEPHSMTVPVGVALRHPYDVNEFYEVDYRSRPHACRWPVGGHDAVEDGVDTMQDLLALDRQLLSGKVGDVAVVIF